MKRQFVDDPSYSSAIVSPDEVATCREQLTAVKVTTLLSEVSRRFAKELTKDQMASILSTACDVLNALGNTLERSGAPDVCAQLRSAALKCANMLPEKWVVVVVGKVAWYACSGVCVWSCCVQTC
jgi:hypothetical protein